MRGLITLFIIASALVVTPVYSQDGTQLKGPKGVDYSAQERSIGPIKPTDTLWRIAAKVRPDNSVNIYQVMVALYEKNPSSFLDKNLNHMRNGAYLKVPTIAQMRAISSALAKQRSEQDDELWEKKKNGTLTKNDIATSQKKLTQARRADVDQAKQELQQKINTIKTEQDMRLVELQNQFKSSVKNVEELLIENNKLKQQLTSISTELENVRNQLGQDSEIQIQLKGLISKQNEIIEQQKVKKQHNSEFSIVGLLSSPLILILMMAIAALLIIAGIVFFLKNRNNQELKANDEGDFLLQAPTYNADENNDLDPGLEPISSNSTDGENDDLSVRLDDGLDSDILPEDDDMMFDDPLEGLLNDDVFFDDEKSDDDDLDISLQQDFDQTAGDSLRDDIDLDSDPEEKNTDNILSEELASEEDDEDLDIDSLIDEALAGSADELSEAQEELDVDDVESLASSLTDEPELDDTPLGAESELEN
ncbi:FimV/HubP family polar landmark protein, partial [Pseudoalteromonas sp.]